MPQAVEVTRLLQAIEQFRARAPRDLPDGVLQGLDEVEKQLGETEPASSPGRAEAQKVSASATDGATGTHFSKAARGPDTPSPGQREAMSVSEEIEKAAASITDRVKNDRANAA